MKNTAFKIGNLLVQPGERLTVALPTPELYTCTPIYIPIHVIHGKKAGPTLLICGAMHGDEANGVAITQKLLKLRLLKSIRGTLLVIPTLNIYGMVTLSRNLPDRRDLEGSFPGTKTGSFASRLAYFLSEEIFSHITHCIDLHTGEPHISMFPQVKTLLAHEESKQMASHFRAPVMMDSESEEGLLWLLHRKEGKIPTILFETGEALRLDSRGVNMGVKGIVRVMRNLEMLSAPLKEKPGQPSVQLGSPRWVRSASSGFCEVYHKEGTFVKKGTLLAKISDPFGTEQKEELHAPIDGIVIARNHLPILNEGEPILKLAETKQGAVQKLEEWTKADKDEGHFE